MRPSTSLPALVAAIAVSIASGCAPLHVTISRTHNALDDLETATDAGPSGQLLGSIGDAEGRDILELPSGGLVITGVAACGFVARLRPDGSRTWLTPLPSCSSTGAHLASAGDDALYASFVDDSSEAAGTSRTAVGFSVVRLDHSGRIVWRVREPQPYPFVTPLAATRDLVAVANRGRILALAPGGRVRWRVTIETDLAKRTLVRAIWIAGAVVIALVDRDAGSALRAFDAATGAVAWEIPLHGDRGQQDVVDPAHFSMSPIGGVFAVWRSTPAHTGGWKVAQFDPRTGAIGWERWLDDQSANRPVLRSARFEDVHAVLRLSLANEAFTRVGEVFVGVDPATGRMLRFPDPELTGDVVNPSYLEMMSFTLGRSGLIATGSFFDRLEWDGLDARSPHHRETACGRDAGFDDACAWSYRARAEEVALFFARIPPD